MDKADIKSTYSVSPSGVLTFREGITFIGCRDYFYEYFKREDIRKVVLPRSLLRLEGVSKSFPKVSSKVVRNVYNFAYELVGGVSRDEYLRIVRSRGNELME